MVIMGVIRRTIYASALTGAAVVGYLGTTTQLTSPLSHDDPIWRSKPHSRYNKHRNPATQDIVTRRIPLEKIKPELLRSEKDLTVEFCRGVWTGLGYRFQRAYLSAKYESAETSDQLWTADQLSLSTYEPGTVVTDHFEVVSKTPNEITVRCGDTPRNQNPRDSDGLFIISAHVDRARREVVLGLKSCLFTSAQRIEGTAGPMPAWLENLHFWVVTAQMVGEGKGGE